MRSVGSVLAALCLAGASHPARAQGVDGHWRLIENPYRSAIEVWVGAEGLSVDVGCTHVGLDMDPRAVQTTRPEGLVFEAPCYDDERPDRTVNAYWDRVIRQIENVRTLRRKGSRLVLTSTDGRRLVFARVEP